MEYNWVAIICILIIILEIIVYITRIDRIIMRRIRRRKNFIIAYGKDRKAFKKKEFESSILRDINRDIEKNNKGKVSRHAF